MAAEIVISIICRKLYGVVAFMQLCFKVHGFVLVHAVKPRE